MLSMKGSDVAVRGAYSMLLRLSFLFIMLFVSSGTAFAAPTVEPNQRVKRNVVVRAAPTTKAAALNALDPGERLELIGEVSRWYLVRLPDGRTGYVSKTWTIVVDVDARGVLRAHFIDVDQGAAALLEF